MAKRKVIVPIDSVLDLLKHYTAENNEIPVDARPVTLMVKPQETGKFAIIAASPEWTKELPPLEIKFDIQRVFQA